MEVSSRASEASSSSVKSRSAKSSIEGFGFDKAASSRLEFEVEVEFEFEAEVVEAEGCPLEGAVAACEVVAVALVTIPEKAEGAAGGQVRGASSRRNCRNSPNSTLRHDSCGQRDPSASRRLWKVLLLCVQDSRLVHVLDGSDGFPVDEDER